MPQQNADRLLKRITALHDSLKLDEGGHVTKMERDLMLNYLREFYDFYASRKLVLVAAQNAPALPPAPPPPAPSRPAPPPPPPLARPRGPAAPASVSAPPKVSVPPEPPVVERATLQAPPTPPQPKPAPREMERPPVPPRMPSVPSVPVPPPPPPVVQANTAKIQPNFAPATAPTKDREDVAALYDDQGVNSRFGRQPIPDLTRALSINNRILFTRKLFGGDNDLLGTTLQQLNQAATFSDAKPLLSSLARRFDWMADGKEETAKEFIELTRRRYV